MVASHELIFRDRYLSKIRVQAARASMTDPTEAAKYKNVFTAITTILREEGVRALYKGVMFTVARQGELVAMRSGRPDSDPLSEQQRRTRP